MWQTVVVLLILAAVLIYVVRHYAGVFRGEKSACSSCSDSCCAQRQVEQDRCGCSPLRTLPEQEGRKT